MTEYKVGSLQGGISENAWRASVRFSDDGIELTIVADGNSRSHAVDRLGFRLVRIEDEIQKAREAMLGG